MSERTQIAVRLSDAVIAALDERAARERRTRSDVLRLILEDALLPKPQATTQPRSTRIGGRR
jgi:metal-responsive CopG/Arc/MetJ family transcriptional regulator